MLSLKYTLEFNIKFLNFNFIKPQYLHTYVSACQSMHRYQPIA